MSNGSGYDPLNYGIRDAFQARNAQEFQLKMLENAIQATNAQERRFKMLENAVQYQPGNNDVMKTETVWADNKPLYTYPAGMFGDIPLNGNWHDVTEYVEKHLPDGEWLVREDYDVNYCRHRVLIENLTTDFHVRMDINNEDWDKMYAIDLVNEVLRQMIANSPQKIQPIEPAEPKIMKCEVCWGPMEAPYTLCKFCGQTYRIGGK